MDIQTILLMPPLLLAQQITTTVSTRAKTSASVWYCGVAAFGSHLTWGLSNSFIIFKMGKEANENGLMGAGLMLLLYSGCCTIGNIMGFWLAHKYEQRPNKITLTEETNSSC